MLIIKTLIIINHLDLGTEYSRINNWTLINCNVMNIVVYINNNIV